MCGSAYKKPDAILWYAAGRRVARYQGLESRGQGHFTATIP